MVLSHVSLALSMRLRLVSVLGEFLWSGERPVDDDVQCLQSISTWLVIDRRVDYTETCTLLGPTCWVGERPVGAKDPSPIHEGAFKTH